MRRREAVPVPSPANAPPQRTAPVLVDSKPEATPKTEQPVAQPRWSARRKLAAVLLGAGAAAGVAAGLLTGGTTVVTTDGGPRIDGCRRHPPVPMDWLERQRQNDDLLRSIQHVDTINKALAGAAVARHPGIRRAGRRAESISDDRAAPGRRCGYVALALSRHRHVVWGQKGQLQQRMAWAAPAMIEPIADGYALTPVTAFPAAHCPL